MEEISKNPIGNSENFLTSELDSKYGISTAAIYIRLNALRIKPYKQDGRSYITSEQLKLMDEFHAHLQSGGKTDEFVQQKIASGEVLLPVEKPPETDLVVQEPPINAIATEQDHSSVPVSESTISPESSAQGEIEHLEAQRTRRVSASDIREADQVAQQRAFAIAAAEESLTLIYKATEEFTLPGLKEQLEAHRAACREVTKKAVATSYGVNDFLSRALEGPLQAARDNGLIN